MARLAATAEEKAFGVAFGAAIRARREKRGWTAQRLAEAAGLSVDGVRRIEVGTVADPGIQTVARIAGSLTTSVDGLLRAARREEQA